MSGINRFIKVQKTINDPWDPSSFETLSGHPTTGSLIGSNTMSISQDALPNAYREFLEVHQFNTSQSYARWKTGTENSGYDYFYNIGFVSNETGYCALEVIGNSVNPNGPVGVNVFQDVSYEQVAGYPRDNVTIRSQASTVDNRLKAVR